MTWGKVGKEKKSENRMIISPRRQDYLCKNPKKTKKDLKIIK